MELVDGNESVNISRLVFGPILKYQLPRMMQPVLLSSNIIKKLSVVASVNEMNIRKVSMVNTTPRMDIIQRRRTF